MKKILAYFFIIIGIGLLFISTSKKTMQAISDKRNNKYGLFGTHHANPDLVNMSYLDDVPKFMERPADIYKRPADTTDKNLDLYLFGDSYVVFIPDSAYAHVSHFYSGRRDYTKLYYKLDPGKRNILIFENGERFARLWLRYTFIYASVMRDTGTAASSFRWPSVGSGLTNASLNIDIDQLFNPDINPNLEYNLFNYNFINPIRQMKANLNYRLFNRASGDVVISDNGNQLFLKQTLAEKNDMSSYEKLDPQIITTVVDTVCAIYKHYRNEGFDEVYISIPPNPVSILQPRYYNGFIPAVKRKLDSAGVPYIDDYDAFIKHPDKPSLYFSGDTHWSGNGQQIWLQTVNDLLTMESRRAKTKMDSASGNLVRSGSPTGETLSRR